MADFTADQFAQRALDAGLLDTRQIESLWSELGTRSATLEEFTNLAVRRELLTNFQIDRLIAGQRLGYFYGDYKMLYMVGAGTFARVYRAMHKNDNRVFAIKVLRQRYSDDPEKTDSFLREAKMVIPLRHPNIVPIYAVDAERNRPFMVMDFVEGRNLRDFLRVRKKLEVAESLRLLADVCSGLDYALREIGLTHRDLKLSNVLVSSAGKARLVDFGLAAIDGEKAEGELAAGGAGPRSIDYAGLERATGVRRDDRRSDIFFAGCMLYHIVSGHSPLYETKERTKRLNVARYRDTKPVVEWEPNLPHHVVSVIGKAMELDPAKRYQDPGELLADLRLSMQRIEAGDVRPSATAMESSAVSEPSASLEALEGNNRVVMVVEANVGVQDFMRQNLKKLGYRVLVISSPERALKRFEDEHKAPADCVVFSTVDLGYSGLRAFNEFGQNKETAHVPAVLLVGENQKVSPKDGQFSQHRVCVTMPMRFKRFRAQLKTLIDQHVNSA